MKMAVVLSVSELESAYKRIKSWNFWISECCFCVVVLALGCNFWAQIWRRLLETAWRKSSHISAFDFNILSYDLTQPLIITSQYSLFGQISLVFAFDAEIDKSTQLFCLNSLNLQPLVLDTLANLAADAYTSTAYMCMRVVICVYIRNRVYACIHVYIDVRIGL